MNLSNGHPANPFTSRPRVACSRGSADANPADDSDEGYMLLGLIVAIAILLLWLSVAATHEAFAIRREREVETARRADQYVRAIRRFYLKLGHYPGSLEQLEGTNNIRFLRRRWVDPLTGTTEWRTIPVGQNKTTPRGFFGEPLAGLPTSGLGALAGSQSPGMPGSPIAGATGAAPGSGAPNASAGPSGGFGSTAGPVGSILGTPGSSLGAPSNPGSATPSGALSPGSPIGTAGAGANNSPTAGGTNSPLGSSASGSSGAGNIKGAFMGVGTNATGNSILEPNGQTTYETWEFLYDPRVEQLRLKQQLNAGATSNGAGTFGQSPASGAFGQPTTPGQPTQPGQPAQPGQPSAPGGFGQPFGSTPTSPATTPNQPVLGGDAPLRP